jgi:DNA polymerase-3 subunit chi
MSANCQVDFYLLGSPALEAERLACKLALMAWERGHRVSVVGRDDQQLETLDRLMWMTPEGRFLPHERGDTHAAPIRLVPRPPGDGGDVVINLTDSPLSPTAGWSRVLEIVPHDTKERATSREKFRAYRAQGLDPRKHDIN